MTIKESKHGTDKPEPICFRVEKLGGVVAQRFIRWEWLHWFIGNNKALPDGVGITIAVEKIIAHQFGEGEPTRFEWNHAPYQLTDKEDIEVFIYHVVRTRV